MKVRCTTSKLRLRLNREDISTLKSTGRCVLHVNPWLSFVLERGPNWTHNHDGQHIHLLVPAHTLDTWLTGDAIALNHQFEQWSLSIERDLKCTSDKKHCSEQELAFDWPHNPENLP